MSESDPTDHALATIASILDQPESPPEVERPMSGPRPAVPAMATTDGDGYSKIGPGPIAAIRSFSRMSETISPASVLAFSTTRLGVIYSSIIRYAISPTLRAATTR